MGQVSTSRSVCAILMIAGLAAWPRPAAADDEFTEVGVVVNVLKGAAEATDQQIKDAIDEANKILKPQAKVKLSLKKTNRDVSDEGNNDGRIDPDEREKLGTKGQEELDSVVGKGKGFSGTFRLPATRPIGSLLA